jgi:hypothetical protein
VELGNDVVVEDYVVEGDMGVGSVVEDYVVEGNWAGIMEDNMVEVLEAFVVGDLVVDLYLWKMVGLFR